MSERSAKSKRILYWSVVALLSLVIVVCVVKIGYKLITDAKDKQDYDVLESLVASAGADETRPPIPTDGPAQPTQPSEPEEESTEPQETEPPQILDRYKLLYELNSDTVGWIEIPGTTIAYPVVQSPYHADFYLRKNFNKVGAACGTIYVRELCDVFRPSDNVTIYGHNMISNGTMFADLHLYEQESFWKDNRYVHFDTLYEYHSYEIFSVFITTADLAEGFNYHLFDDALDAQEYDGFVAKCKELSLYDTGITPKYGEKLITLSTCDKSIEDGRFVIVARRVL